MRAEVLPDLGAGLASLDVRGPDRAWYPLLRCAPADARWFNELACYALAPWPNRIAAGRFAFDGREHRIPTDWPDGTAIHGLVKDKPWRLIERTPVSAVLWYEQRTGSPWPWAFGCVARYELLEDGLALSLSLTNQSDSPMPAGLGFHPFFTRALWAGEEDVLLRYRPTGHYPCERMIPCGEPIADDLVNAMRAGPVSIAPLSLDDVFAGTTDGSEVLWPRSGIGVRFECSPSLGHGVLFTQQPGSFCFEPVTMVNDGFNLAARGNKETGVRRLDPGQELTARWAMRMHAIHGTRHTREAL